jgi:cob(I)alamin adenosyltransferase
MGIFSAPAATRRGGRPPLGCPTDAAAPCAGRSVHRRIPDDRLLPDNAPLPRWDREQLDMANRLSKIVTRTGDDGTTGLGDGSRVRKESSRIAAIGEVDELNSALGLLRAEPLAAPVDAMLAGIQHDLFDLGGELSIPGYSAVTDAHVERLEAVIEAHNGGLPPLKDFILPGGTRPAALAHLCRTVCRRAERSIVHLAATQVVGESSRRYLNRLSDLFFVLARVLNRDAGHADVLWQKGRSIGAR